MKLQKELCCETERIHLIVMLYLLASPSSLVTAETISIWIPGTISPRVNFGVQRLAEALEDAGIYNIAVKQSILPSRKPIIGVGIIKQNESLQRLLPLGMREKNPPGKEGYILVTSRKDVTVVAGHDDSGVLYGCLELADRIRSSKTIPGDLKVIDAPT